MGERWELRRKATTYKKDNERDLVLVVSQMKRFLQARKFSLADINTVEEARMFKLYFYLSKQPFINNREHYNFGKIAESSLKRTRVDICMVRRRERDKRGKVEFLNEKYRSRGR